tara:strand:+ start:216 stop:1799 length:1584 start_codon:yes stop_codon:yes gene_type:complete
MATFGDQIIGLISSSVTADTKPSITQVDSFLNNGIKCTVNAILGVNPAEAIKFAVSTEDANNSGVLVTGQLLSVIREHNSTVILRPCEYIDSNQRYLASDNESLHYRTKYNPGYYILNGSIHTVPISAAGDNSSIVSQVGYASLDGEDDVITIASTTIKNFPDEYEHMVIMYATAMVCSAKAANIHNEFSVEPKLSYAYDNISIPTFTVPVLNDTFILPDFFIPALVTPTLPNTSAFTLPTFENVPVFVHPEFKPPTALDVPSVDFAHPSIPELVLPALDFNLSGVSKQLNSEDIELADKQLELVSKKLENFDKQFDLTKEKYSADTKQYDKEFEEAKLEYETEFAKLKDQFDKDFQEAVQNYDKDFQSNKSNFDTKWEEQKTVYQSDFTRQQTEFEKEWDEDKIEYQTEFQNRIKTFDANFQASSIKYNKEWERQAIAHKALLDEDVLEFQTQVQIDMKNAESKMALEIQRVQSDIAVYQANIGKLTQQYNWWIGQYQTYMGQFVNNVQMKALPKPQPQEQEERRR